MVRLGIPIYGLSPFNSNYQRWLVKEAVDTISRLKPVLTLKTGISFIKKIKKLSIRWLPFGVFVN